MILITGGMGFIGLNCARAFLDAGEDVLLTRFSTYREPQFLKRQLQKRAFVEQVDALDATSLSAAGRKYPIDGIVHLVGGGMRGALSESFLTNMRSLTAALEAARVLEVKRITLASTIGVYFGVGGERWSEAALLPVDSPHQMIAHKKVLEICSDCFSRSTGVSIACVRFAAYGPLQRSLLFPPSRLVRAALKGVTAPELQPGEEPPYEDDSADWAYVTDVAEGIAQIQRAPQLNHRIYNVGSGRSVANREFAAAIRRVVPGAQIRMRPGASPGGCHPPFDLARVREDTGWQPRFDVDTGIADYVDWLRAGNPD